MSLSIVAQKIKLVALQISSTHSPAAPSSGKEPPTSYTSSHKLTTSNRIVVAGQILGNVLTILALVYTVNGLLTWIGRGFGIYELTIQLVVGYVLYPVTFFMGVPRGEIYRVAKLLATKLVANEFVAYLELQAIRESANPLSARAEIIASYALCGFANLASLGIQIGVLSSLGPARGKSIARLAPSAMLCGFLSTMQTAGIAYVLSTSRVDSLLMCSSGMLV